jgi:hypothetical protein
VTPAGGAARRPLLWLGGGYLALCAAVTGVVFFAPYAGPVPYWCMVLLTMPLSLAVMLVHYIGFVLVFGIEDWWLPRTASFVLWVGVAVAQVAIARVVIRAGRPAGRTGPAPGHGTG